MIEGTNNNSNVKRTIVLFGTNEFVALINAGYYTTDDKKIAEEIISSTKFDINKVNLEPDNQENIDLTISNFKFSNSISGFATYSKLGNDDDAFGLSNCFMYVVLDEEENAPKHLIASTENSFSTFLFPSATIEENSISFNNYSGNYKIYDAEIMGVNEVRISIYIIVGNNKTLIFFASSIDNHDYYQEIFRKTVESVKL